VNCNLYGVGGSFNLRVKIWRKKVFSWVLALLDRVMGSILKRTRLQRLFSRLSIHFFPCVGSKLGGFFLGCLGFLIGCLGSFLGCLVIFINYLDWFLGCW